MKVPQVRGELEFYPSSIEKWTRSERALKLTIAEMYINGVSTRRVSEIVETLCGAEISSTQVGKAAQLLDEEIDTWRNREIGEIKYLILDATCESVRMGVSVVSGAVLVAVGVAVQGRRRILGVSTSVREAEVHWRTFLQSLLKRQMKEIKLRTRVAMVFPNERSLLRLVSAILMEVDEQWQQGKRYLPTESE